MQQSRTCLQSRRNLIEAFLQIYPQKPLEKITIKEITDLAGYNRSTFYLYFQDIYALADAAEDGILQLLKQKFDDIFCQEKNLYLPELMLKFAESSVKYAEYIYIFSDSKSFRTKFSQIIQKNLQQIGADITLRSTGEYFDFIVSFVSSTILHNIVYYYDHNCKFDLLEMIALCQRIIMPGLSQMIKFSD